MTLANILRRKLSDTPSAGEPAPGARHELSVADDTSGWTVYLTADRRDRWTTVAWELALRRGTPQGDVASWAQRIAERTGGLLETLRVVEVDAANDRALVRSALPSEEEGKLFYYEVLLHGTTSALVRRFEGVHGSGKRQQISFALTNEVLTRLVGSLTEE